MGFGITCHNCGHSDRCHLEGARRLRQDAAVQGGAGIEHSGGVSQNDALHMRRCTHSDLSRNLPEDVTRLWAIEEHAHGRSHNHGTRCLDDEDVVFLAFESDVLIDVDICGEGVDTGRQSQSIVVEYAGKEIELGGGARRGVSVRGLHGEDCNGQIRRAPRIARPETLPCYLRGRRIESRGVQGKAEAGHGRSGYGRDGDVAGDCGLGHGGDPALCENHVVAGSPEIDSSCRQRVGQTRVVFSRDKGYLKCHESCSKMFGFGQVSSNVKRKSLLIRAKLLPNAACRNHVNA